MYCHILDFPNRNQIFHSILNCIMKANILTTCKSCFLYLNNICLRFLIKTKGCTTFCQQLLFEKAMISQEIDTLTFLNTLISNSAFHTLIQNSRIKCRKKESFFYILFLKDQNDLPPELNVYEVFYHLLKSLTTHHHKIPPPKMWAEGTIC